MNLTVTYQIDEAAFIRIYRAHCHDQFHLRRSFGLSILLLVVMVVLLANGMDFDGMENIVVVLVIISGLCNGYCDFYLPKAAWKNLRMQGEDQGTLIIQNETITMKKRQGDIVRCWNQYQRVIETADAFLLYQRNLFTILMKNCIGDQLDEVRELLKTNINHGKPIKQKQ